MFFAFVGASITKYCACFAQMSGVFSANAHQLGYRKTNYGTLSVKLNTLNKRFNICFMQIFGRAMITFYSTC
jgi:hypothetical protein